MDEAVAGNAAARLARVEPAAGEPEALILVDAADRVVGRLGKTRCHEGKGVLHRAFSLMIFNAAGDLLIQQRSPSKRLWPLYWSNSCCSHPRSGEDMETATRRRLKEELGIACPLQFLYKFQYHAQFDATGSEHELCSVFIGTCAQPIAVDPSEISAWRWVDPHEIGSQLTSSAGLKFTPWFTLEWARIWRDHRDAVLAMRA